MRVNIDLAEQMVCACAAAGPSGARLVLTSSMAAVRAEGQPIAAGRDCYTTSDWNTVSQRDGPSFAPYQYSKTESEQRAWYLAKEVGLEMVSINPAMIFGPPRDPASSAFSVEMARGWARGDAPVRSVLVSDVRDVALAHIRAALAPEAAGRRYIVACERRSPASAEAAAVRRGLRAAEGAGDPSSDVVHAVEGQEMGEGGGAIGIGEQEVDAAAALWSDLGVKCRTSAETLEDMVKALRL